MKEEVLGVGPRQPPEGGCEVWRVVREIGRQVGRGAAEDERLAVRTENQVRTCRLGVMLPEAWPAGRNTHQRRGLCRQITDVDVSRQFPGAVGSGEGIDRRRRQVVRGIDPGEGRTVRTEDELTGAEAVRRLTARCLVQERRRLRLEVADVEVSDRRRVGHWRVWPATAVKFVARLTKATYRPFGLITGSNESPLAGWPSGVALTSDVCPVVVSRTNTCGPLVRVIGVPARSVASLTNTSCVPSALRLPGFDWLGLMS